MQFITNNLTLISLALGSGVLLAWPWIQTLLTAGVTPAQAVLLMNREKAVVVDVREPEEFAAGYIAGSKNIPAKDLQTKLTLAVKNKNVPLILVCQTGLRSGRALAVARQLGYEQARSLGGGIVEWGKANLPIEKA